LRVPRPVRVGLLLASAAAVALVTLVTKDDSVAKNVEMQISAVPGHSLIQLSSHERAPMSPGCGCLEPRLGAHDWFGMSLPSTGFGLDVSAQPSADSDGSRWVVTAVSPSLVPFAWYQSAEHTLRMTVEAGPEGRSRRLFSGRVTYARVITDDQLEVDHGRRFPYAALLPGAGGPVEFDSEFVSRPQFGSTMDVRATGPRRGDVRHFMEMSEREYRRRTDISQRSPMIDLLGPSVRLTVPEAGDLDVFAGELEVRGFRSGEPVTVRLETPFAIRLTPHPANARWVGQLHDLWPRERRRALGGDPESRRNVAQGPTLQGIYVDSSPQPEYSLALNDVKIPSAAVWRGFARLSAREGQIPAMLGNTDYDLPIETVYQLPPVDPNLGISVFGPLERLESSALRGHVVSEGKDVPFGRGEQVSVRSEEGLATGRYQMTPLVAAGRPAAQANIAGIADVSIDGRPVNHHSFLPLLWSAIGFALLGLALEALLKWGVRRP
jgi:hypothetical protein